MPTETGWSQPAWKIPNLAPDASGLLLKLMDTDSNLETLTKELGSVANIVVRLIALSNSAWSKPVSVVSDLETACIRLGLDTVRAVSLGLIVGKSFDSSRCPSFDSANFWTRSMVCSQVAALLADRYGVSVGTARSAGILHNVGLLPLVDSHPEELNRILGATESTDVDDQLRAVFGVGYWQVGHQILEQWNLPDEITSALQEPELISNDSLIAVSRLIRLAARLSSDVCRGPTETLEADWIDKSNLRDVVESQLAGFERTQTMARELFA